MLKALCLGVVVASLIGCASDPAPASETETGSAESASTAQLDGIYKITGGDFAWAAMHDGHYTFWKAGDACNADYAKAPASCAETGTFAIDAGQIAYTNDATGQTTHDTFRPTATSAITTKDVNLGTSSGGTSLTNGTNNNVVQEASLRKGAAVIITLCALIPVIAGTNDDVDKFPEPPPPPPITETCKQGQG